MPVSRTIAGHDFALVPGRRYVATRPMASRGDDVFTVTVSDVTDNGGFDAPAVATVGPLGYDDANELLSGFNDGPSSFLGRIWE